MTTGEVADSTDQIAASTIPDVIEERIYKDTDGKAITTKYARGKLLGKGGFAKCFVAHMLPAKTAYAIKIVCKSTLAKSKAKQKLQSEIRIHRSLKHINIVKFERYFEDDLNSYILLELCHNNSMSELMKRRKKLTEYEVRYYLQQLISSLEFLHSKLVIHRDLKLGNIFLDSNMKVKVGDFGLATRLASRDERRKTVCGTPNYIAPEILEGKDGHSFEVDIWSTGVILYTLFVGKPPFESKDVKSTYKRILANAYTYPEHVFVPESAKNLIRSLLQPKPSCRPSLDAIVAHPFLADAWIPDSLPPGSMHGVPDFSLCKTFETGTSSDLPMAVDENKLGGGKAGGPIYGDENDPAGINKAVSRQKALPSPSAALAASHGLGTGAGQAVVNREKDKTNRKAFGEIPLATNGVNGPDTRMVARRPSSSLSAQSHEPRAIYRASPASSQRPLTRSQAPQAPARLPSAPTGDANKRQGFDIYLDKKPTTAPSASTATGVRVGADTDLQRDLKKRLTINEPRFSSSANATANGDTGSVGSKSSSNSGCGGPHALGQKGAWINDFGLDPATALPMGHHTPNPTQLVLQKKKLQSQGTLEMMHEMLVQNCGESLDCEFMVSDALNAPIFDSVLPLSSALARPLISPPPIEPTDVWVLRYVDYTSKYGLGFLLNNGSAGVYFNDSTKIVLSVDGKIFQYVERKKRVNTGAPSSDHLIQTHLITRYPAELHKKVTLLCHFRNYLLDQHKAGEAAGETGGAVGTENPKMNAVMADHIASGATPELTLGISSVHFPSGSPVQEGEINLGRDSDFFDENDDGMPFLKKWVRTRHAILFRLSNRTVQVVFFDRSEILLSSEARVVTFVNKLGERSVHSLEEVLQSGRRDIAKRLKYTKDIMYRLINIQAK